ncbi:MAG: SH3 domain-containing protein [Lachnospiraceae bacterium]|nr:SH3 domain-containing protein [Lachnospiraceae bacterium]
MKNIQRIIGLWMVLVLFTGSFCITIPMEFVYAYEEKEGVVTGDNVNVRKGAGTGYESIGALNKGHEVHIIGEGTADNGALWYQITFTKDGVSMVGYMHSAYIQINQTGAYEEKDGYVTADGVRVRKGAGTEHEILTSLNTGHAVHIIGEGTASNGVIWYQITFTKDGVSMEGYMHSTYIRVGEPEGPFIPSDGVDDADYESYLEAQGFPESYRRYLRALHKINPLWIFAALPTGIDWERAVAAESKLGTNLVPASSITSYKSLKEGAIDWTTGKWTGMDGASWVPASENVIRYFLDPRNFLEGENTMLQFETLEYKEGEQTIEGINNLIKGTHMEYGRTVIDNQTIDFAQIFMAAGQEHKISPYHLAARAKQETGVNGSNSTKQIKDPEYAEFNGYYNFFNIGASPGNGHNSMYNGLQRAKDEGWDTPEKSIKGGAKFVAERYVGRGQNTLYLQKFDVVDGGDGYYSHQYMTNLQAAASEAKLMEQAYSNFKGATITYIIPIYNNMPSLPKACPTDNGSPYSVLSDLNVGNLQLDQPFDEYTFEYKVLDEVTENSIQINASAYAPGAVITGTGSIPLTPGENRISIQCTGTDGSVRTYTITVKYKEEDQPLMGDVDGNSVINSIDALRILRSTVSLEILADDAKKRADVNRDGQVDANDALMILQYITGQISSFD